MLRLPLTLALMLSLFSVGIAAEPDQDRVVKFVESFIAIPTEQIPPDRVNDFMKVDLTKLPVKIREKAEARKFELYVLKDLTENGRKGSMRITEERCKINDEAKTDDAKLLKTAGFTEITEEEETQIEKDTNCTQRDLMCEFSLQILLKKDKKGNPAPGKRFFLHPNDPMMQIVRVARGAELEPFRKPNCSH